MADTTPSQGPLRLAEALERMRPEFCGNQATLLEAAALIREQHAALAAPQPNAAADGWMPIETAPKDGTEIDLFSRHGHREAGAAWGLPPHECGEMGRYCDSEWHDYEPGWVTDFWGEPQPDSEFTHWRPLPAPPTLSASKEG